MSHLDFSVAFGFGLVTSLHCAQMCGPLVLSYSLAGRGTLLSHLLYNLGRMATYAGLGMAAGAAGSAVGLLGRLAGYRHTALLLAGVLLILAGILMSGLLPRAGLVRIERFGVTRLFSKLIGQLMSQPHPAGRLGLGLVMGFLPCGMLYAALLQAAATGSVWSGALFMVLFGMGTSASLLAIGLFSAPLGAKLGRWSRVLAAASVMLMGALLIWKALGTGPAMPMGSSHGHF